MPRKGCSFLDKNVREGEEVEGDRWEEEEIGRRRGVSGGGIKRKGRRMRGRIVMGIEGGGGE